MSAEAARRGWIGISAVLLAVFALSLALRWPLIADRPMTGFADNEDAASHVLLTLRAIDAAPPGAFGLLPAVTLGDASDRFVDNFPGAAIATPDGHFVYLSFPPLGFLAPYAALKFAGLPFDPLPLRLFDAGLQLLAAGLLAACAAALLANRPEADRRLGALVAGLAYLSAPEALLSHSLSYWAHQLYEPLFLGQLLLFLRRRTGPGFLALAVLGCLVEWQAYFANAGFALAALIAGRSGARRLALALGAASLAGAMIHLGWVAAVLPMDEALAALSGRYEARSEGDATAWARLRDGWYLSIGLPLLAFGLFLSVRLLAGLKPDGRRALASAEGGLALAALIVLGLRCLENPLLVGHAATYGLDRLKLVTLCAVLLALLAVRARLDRRVVAGLALAVAGIGCLAFARAHVWGVDFTAGAYRFHAETGSWIAAAARPGEPVHADLTARGTMIFYAGRNLRPPPAAMDALCRSLADPLSGSALHLRMWMRGPPAPDRAARYDDALAMLLARPARPTPQRLDITASLWRYQRGRLPERLRQGDF